MNEKRNNIAIVITIIIIIVIRTIGYDNIPKPILIISIFAGILVIIVWLLKSNYLRTHGIYFSLFFILLCVMAGLIGIDITFESNKFYSQRISKYVSGFAFALFWMSLVSGIIGAINQGKKN